jgi:hypothetical protein
MDQLSTEMRTGIINSGLTDREDKVRDAAKKLIVKWLAGVDDSVPALMRSINPVDNEAEAQLLGAFLMEELMTNDTHFSGSMKGTVNEAYSKWSSGVKVRGDVGLLPCCCC